MSRGPHPQSRSRACLQAAVWVEVTGDCKVPQGGGASSQGLPLLSSSPTGCNTDASNASLLNRGLSSSTGEP